MPAIYLVRHAQASFGAADYDQLSALGFTQATHLGRALSTRLPRVDRVICGSMRRHQQTAAACLASMGLANEWTEDRDWDEFDPTPVIAAHTPAFADPAQLRAHLATTRNPRAAFQQLFTAAVQRWVSGAHDADYPEPWHRFEHRVHAALARLAQHQRSGETALVFTSGGPIGALVCASFETIPAALPRVLSHLVNAGISKLVYGQGGFPQLISYNDHGHFEGAHAELITYR